MLNQTFMVSTEKGVPTKMSNQQWLVGYLYQQESEPACLVQKEELYRLQDRTIFL